MRRGSEPSPHGTQWEGRHPLPKLLYVIKTPFIQFYKVRLSSCHIGVRPMNQRTLLGPDSSEVRTRHAFHEQRLPVGIRSSAFVSSGKSVKPAYS